MYKGIKQDMAYRQSLMKYAEKYGVSCASRISWADCRRTLPRMCPAMCRNTPTKSVLNL